MNDTCILPTTTRRYIGPLRHINVFAAKVDEGEVADLAHEVAGELTEVCFLPQIGEYFIRHLLQTAGVGEEELLQKCQELRLKVLSYFTALTPEKAEWSFAVKHFGHGIVITAVVGDPRSMLVAREHGLIP